MDYRPLKDLLVQRFKIEEMRTLCFDIGFNYELISNENVDVMARELVIYCQRQELIDPLMDAMGRMNAYTSERLKQLYPDHAQKPPVSEFENTGAPKMDFPSDLGFGIQLKGIYETHDLEVYAPLDWEKMYDGCKAKSGWLYDSTAERSVAIAFFKIQIYDNGRGSIHISDVSHPAHRIWMITAADLNPPEGMFHYIDNPHQVWHFKWARQPNE